MRHPDLDAIAWSSSNSGREVNGDALVAPGDPGWLMGRRRIQGARVTVMVLVSVLDRVWPMAPAVRAR
jgi:hypothetical protein